MFSSELEQMDTTAIREGLEFEAEVGKVEELNPIGNTATEVLFASGAKLTGADNRKV